MTRNRAAGSAAKPYDATTKHLVEEYIEDWLTYLGLGGTRVQVRDADVSTVTAAGDKVFLLEDWQCMAEIDLQSDYDATLPDRSLEYNVLVRRRHGLPVMSIVVLLRKAADGPEMTGVVTDRIPGAERYLEFHYRVVRVWEEPVEKMLEGGLGTLPLAVLADTSSVAMPEVVRKMDARISEEASPADAGVLWSATYILMGLRYPAAVATELLKGVRKMQSSTTYQAILAEGEAKGRSEEARALVFKQGSKRFGPPTPEAQRRLTALRSLHRIEKLAERLLDVASWDELLQGK